jgi:hypothetical protein
MSYSAFVTPKPKPAPASRGTSFSEGVGEFLLGTTSWKKAAKDAATGDWAGAAANAGWGAVSVGSTLISFVPGVGTAAGAGIKGAAAAAKAGKAVKTLEAGKTTVTGVKGGQAVAKTVAGGKAAPKPVMYSPGYPFKPTAPARTAPTAPARPVTATPKSVPDATPDFPILNPQAKRSPWISAAQNVGLSAGTSVATSAMYNYATAPHGSTQPQTQTQPQTSNPNPNGTGTGTGSNPRRYDDNVSNSFSVGTQFANIPKVF